MKTCLRMLAAMLLAYTTQPASLAEQIEENWQPYVTYKPDPVLPQVALRLGWGGIGIYRLAINSRNGEVEEVKVLQRTNYPKLDAEMVMTLFKWRFKPNTLKHAKIIYQIGVYGRARDYHTGRY